MFAQVSGPRIRDKRESYFRLLNAWRRAGRSQDHGLNSAWVWGFMLPSPHRHAARQRRLEVPLLKAPVRNK